MGLTACGEERTNNMTPGNVLLASQDATTSAGTGGWSLQAVQADMNINRCKVASEKSGTQLICTDSMGAVSEGEVRWWFSLDFSKPAGARRRILGRVYDSGWSTHCSVGMDVFATKPVTAVEFKNEELRDIDADGDRDLVVTLTRAHRPGSAALVSQAKALCAREKRSRNSSGWIKLKRLVGAPKRHELRFIRHTSGMKPTAQTKKLLEKWEAESPKFWLELVGK